MWRQGRERKTAFKILLEQLSDVDAVDKVKMTFTYMLTSTPATNCPPSMSILISIAFV